MSATRNIIGIGAVYKVRHAIFDQF